MSTSQHPREGDASPWGVIAQVKPLGPEAVTVMTASHGGIWVTAAALERIPEPLRSTAYSGGGWFEEDADWCIPYLVLQLHRFDGEPERQAQGLHQARRALDHWHAAHAHLVNRAPVEGSPS